ncbi:hypothetical protein RhiJN_05142 [Ceratobasidium sp. AG-Ba]|nr:hypothetical protein RhiJN_05142 [Ceratobasidium sp. AG-Ba]QRW06067.1 hypothetical protein RhiLY_05066 [Ceratobasidium sp. AG-Ba]
MPAVTRSRSHSRTHSPVDESSILNPHPSQTSQMSSEEILSEVRDLKKLVEKLLSLREEDQATIQRMENQLQSLVGKGGDDGDEDSDLGDQTVGPSNTAAVVGGHVPWVGSCIIHSYRIVSAAHRRVHRGDESGIDYLRVLCLLYYPLRVFSAF